MTDPFTPLGLQDRSRTFPPVSNADLDINVLQVDKLIIGGVEIFASQGTRYANGRLTVQGRGDNSMELELKPGFDCKGKGVVTQIIWYAMNMKDYFKRFAISITRDGTDPNGIDDQLVTVDSSRSSNVSAMPVYMPVMGDKSNPDGTDVPGSGKYSFSYFQDGSHEMHLRDDKLRVEMASFAEAFLANDRTLIRAREKQADGSWEQLTFNNNTPFDEL